MTETNQRFRDYDHAYLLLLERLLEGFHIIDPVLRYFPPEKVAHTGPMRYVHDQGTTEQQMEYGKFDASGEVDFLNGRIEQHTGFIYELVQSYVRTAAAQCFAKVSDLAGDLGNSARAVGKALSIDTLLDGIEMTEMRFTHQGEIPISVIPHDCVDVDHSLVMSLPECIVVFIHPEKAERLGSTLWTDDHRQRYREMILRKQREFYASKRTRRLS